MRFATWAVLGALPGCVVVEKTTALDNEVFTEPVSAVAADLGAGNLTVSVGSGISEVTVARTAHWTGDAPEAEAWVDGGTLHLEVDCRTLQRVCAVDHEVIVPNVIALDAVLGSGNVTADGLAGPVNVDVGSGSVSLQDLEGDAVVTTGSGSISIFGAIGTLALDSGSGAIDVSEADVSTASAKTGSGSVAMALAGAPSHVDIETGSGSVDLGVPAGTYDVDAEVGGTLTLDGITAEQGANATIHITTGSGSATVYAL